MITVWLYLSILTFVVLLNNGSVYIHKKSTVSPDLHESKCT